MSGASRIRRKSGKRLSAIFAVPGLLFIVGLAGLVAALLVEGAGDLPAALAAGSGLAVLVLVICRRR
ncbi:hypothetical protein [Henriciella litoralis]|uniref:hypothetical protein n=1 Tax=Henriciella litoralis TaxID=568102 RepID=UPI000A02DD96|nr:hypothetical protein [Henriciella litoralis]